MKIITNDYGCGTSASILDYNIKDVVIVSEKNYKHVYDIDDDVFFVGHDFLFYLWDTPEKIKKWKSNKHRKAVWCFERINAIVPQWKQKGEYSLSLLKQFVDQIYVCDEDDAKVYGDWLPQWASPRFYNLKDEIQVKTPMILFSGQAGKSEYSYRTNLLNQIFLDNDLKKMFRITNFDRSLSWNEYCSNLLVHSAILNPVGILRGFNTRTYEVMYSGRHLLQQTFGKYDRHESLLEGHKNVVLFNNFDEMKSKIIELGIDKKNSKPEEFFKNNNLYARFKSIGVDIK